MLVTFSSDSYENIVMFGDVAKQLLIMMGNSGTIPGALVADEIPNSLACLEKKLARIKSGNSSAQVEDNDNEYEPDISIATRAIPLINMLKAAIKNKSNIMWQ